MQSRVIGVVEADMLRQVELPVNVFGGSVDPNSRKNDDNIPVT